MFQKSFLVLLLILTAAKAHAIGSAPRAISFYDAKNKHWEEIEIPYDFNNPANFVARSVSATCENVNYIYARVPFTIIVRNQVFVSENTLTSIGYWLNTPHSCAFSWADVRSFTLKFHSESNPTLKLSLILGGTLLHRFTEDEIQVFYGDEDIPFVGNVTLHWY